jgi:tetratricopeptide (TPR) repeat protein
MTLNIDVASAIRDWLDHTCDAGSPDRFSITRIRRRSANLITSLRIPGFGAASVVFTVDDEMVDVLHATIEALSGYRRRPSRKLLADIENFYKLLSTLEWPDEFGEREEMLATSAFLAWNQCRLIGDYRHGLSWQSRCVDHVLSQEHLRHFLALPFSERSPGLIERFLSDEAMLLASCASLERERNLAPVEALREGQQLYACVKHRLSAGCPPTELLNFFAANVALSLVVTGYHLQDAEAMNRWESVSKRHLDQCLGAEPIRANLEQVRLSRVYDEYKISSETASACDALVRRLDNLGMRQLAARTRFLHGLVLKELGSFEASLESLVDARARASQSDDLLTVSLSMATFAQIQGLQGHFVAALERAKESVHAAIESRCSWVLAHAQGSVAELLRDHGNLAESIEAYQASISTLDGIGMAARAAYTRVLLAEAMLMAERAVESASEILRALPVIERHKLSREAVAAVAILRQAIHRQQADPEALGQLRQQLDLMRREHKL